jgi:hypothetical protein
MTHFLKKLSLFSLIFSFPLFAQEECCDEEIPCVGKIDIGAAFIHVDLLKSGVTRHRMDLGGIKAEFNYRFWKCLILKPSFLYGQARRKDRVVNGGVGLGFYIPVAKGLTVTPSFGCIWGNLRTNYKAEVEVEVPGVPTPVSVSVPVKEKFYSSSPYLALELSYTFIPTWRVVFTYQYSWSHTRTTIKPLLKEKSHSQGSNYSAMLEHDFNQHWSINAAAAYNVSLTKEKHGLRAYGCKVGVAYWF